MNTKMTLNELKAKLDLIPGELGDLNVLLLPKKGQGDVINKPDTVFLGTADNLDNGQTVVTPIHDPNNDHKANAVVIASTY